MISITKGIDTLLKHLKEGNIDFSTIDFVTPILLLGTLSYYRQGKIKIKGLDSGHYFNPNVYDYLVHSGFIDYFKLDNISPQLNYQNLIPISHIYENINPIIADNLANKIISNDKNIKYSFSFIFRELLDNIIRHSKANFDNLTCYYMLQRYPNINNVHICMIDNGIGIKNSLKDKFNFNNDLDYIKKAFEKGITSRGNTGGNGLFFIKKIVEDTNSKLYYWSGDYTYLISDGKENYINTKKDYGLSHQGVLLDMELNLNNLNTDIMKNIGIDIKDELDNLEEDIFI